VPVEPNPTLERRWRTVMGVGAACVIGKRINQEVFVVVVVVDVVVAVVVVVVVVVVKHSVCRMSTYA